MDIKELAFAVCLQQEGVFTNLSKKQLHNLLLTNKMVKDNKDIVMQRNKYTAWHLHNQLCIQVTPLAHIYYHTDEAEKQLYRDNINKIMEEVNSSDDDTRDCFFQIVFAMYKENIFRFMKSILSCYDGFTFKLLKEYDNILHTDEDIYNMLYNHLHDSDHYVFNGVCTNFSFVENELQGDYMLDHWETYNK